jgi:hypothetical protein
MSERIRYVDAIMNIKCARQDKQLAKRLLEFDALRRHRNQVLIEAGL